MPSINFLSSEFELRRRANLGKNPQTMGSKTGGMNCHSHDQAKAHPVSREELIAASMTGEFSPNVMDEHMASPTLPCAVVQQAWQDLTIGTPVVIPRDDSATSPPVLPGVTGSPPTSVGNDYDDHQKIPSVDESGTVDATVQEATMDLKDRVVITARDGPPPALPYSFSSSPTAAGCNADDHQNQKMPAATLINTDEDGLLQEAIMACLNDMPLDSLVPRDGSARSPPFMLDSAAATTCVGDDEDDMKIPAVEKMDTATDDGFLSFVPVDDIIQAQQDGIARISFSGSPFAKVVCAKEDSKCRPSTQLRRQMPDEIYPIAPGISQEDNGFSRDGTGSSPQVIQDYSIATPTVDDESNEPALDDHTLMARALGLHGCDFEELPFREHRRLCTPSIVDLRKEFKRRLGLFGIKRTKANRSKFPCAQSPKETLIKWLRENQIRDEREAGRLQDLVARLRVKVSSAPRAPRYRPSRPKPQLPSSQASEARQEEGKSHNNDGKSRGEDTGFSQEVLKNHWAAVPTGNDESNESVLDEHTVMARALGLQGCDFEEHPFREHRLLCTPNIQDLRKEFKRRLCLFGIKVTRANRHEFPSVQSPKAYLIKWLRANPIRVELEMAMLKSLVARLRNRLNAVPQASESRPPPEYTEDEKQSEEEKANLINTDSSDRNNEIAQNSNSKQPVKVVKRGEPNKSKDRNGNEGQADCNMAMEEERISPRSTMARALGLAGCDFWEGPFQNSRQVRPTNVELYAEARRRFQILGIDLSGNDRSLLPTRSTRRSKLISWLIGNPIPNDHPEVARLQSQVQRLRAQLESDNIDDDGSNGEPVQPIEEEHLVEADRRPETHNGDEWQCLDLRWIEDSDNSTTFDSTESFSLVPSTATLHTALSEEVRAGTAEGVNCQAILSGTGVSDAVSHDQASGDDMEVCSHATAKQSAEEVASLTNASLAVSSSSFTSNSTPSPGEVLVSVFDRSIEASTRNSNSRAVESLGSELSPMSSVSPWIGSSNPSNSTKSSRDTSRLTATSKDLLRLRGRGLETLEEGRVVQFQVQVRPCGAKVGLTETDSVSAMSGGPTSYSVLVDDTDVATVLPTGYDDSECKQGKWRKLVRRTEETGDIASFIRIMADHPMVADVQSEGLDVLWSWALGEDNKKMLVEAGAIPIILQAMRQHQSESSIQRRGCLALGNLAANNVDNKDLIAEAIPVILQAMCKHQSVLRIQRYACYALGKLASNNSHNQNQIAKAGGISVILQAIRQHESVPDIRKYGCYALGNLAANNPQNKDLIAEAGAIPIVLQVMRQHGSVPDIQQYSCLALGNLSADNLHNKHLIAEAGAIPVILEAMRQHPSVADIQDNGCYALGNLAANNLHNKHLIVEAGAIPIILQAMHLHESVPDIQEYGSLALGNVAADNLHNQNLIAESGAIPVIIQAMRQHQSVPYIQQYCCLALGNLAANNLHNQHLISQEGVIPVVLQAMRQHESVPDIQQYGCYALRHLGQKSHSQKLMADAGAIPLVLRAMRQHQSVPAIQRHGCYVLGNLAADNARNQMLISEAGAIPVILETMLHHDSVVPNIQENCCYALEMLILNNLHNRKLIAEAIAFPIFLQSMRQPQSVPDAQGHACSVLWANPTIREMISPTVRQCARRTKRTFPHLDLPGLASWTSMSWW